MSWLYAVLAAIVVVIVLVMLRTRRELVPETVAALADLGPGDLAEVDPLALTCGDDPAQPSRTETGRSRPVRLRC